MALNRYHNTTGSVHFASHNKFEQWKISKDKDGWIRCVFSLKNGRYCFSTFPFNLCLKDEITFDDPKEWDIFIKEFELIFEKQKKLFPDMHKRQKSECVKEINYHRKNYPTDNPLIIEYSNYLLGKCRKRK